MSVLATSGLTCQAYGDCQLPSPSIPSTSHCVTVEVHAPFSPLLPPTHNQSPLGIQQEEISARRKRAREAQLSQAERMVKRSRV